MPEPALPVGSVTFLFSDIEGSTRLLQAVGRDSYGGLLERLAPLNAGADVIGDRNMIGHINQAEGQVSSFAGDVQRAAAAFDKAIAALSELGTVACACHCLDAIAVHLRPGSA